MSFAVGWALIGFGIGVLVRGIAFEIIDARRRHE